MKIKFKFNPAFKKAAKSKARYKILYGGAGSGKSHYIAQKILLDISTRSKYNVLAIRKVHNTIRLSLFAMFEKIIKENGIEKLFVVHQGDMSIKSKLTGNKIVFSGLDNVEKLKSIADVNTIWIEEATDITHKDFDQLDLRLRGVSKWKHEIYMSFNPISEIHWIKRRFFDIGVKDSFILKTTYKDNLYVGEKFLEVLNRLKEDDYQYFRIYALGEWGSIGNLVFKNWRTEDLSDVMAEFDNYFNGLDWGFSVDPLAFVRLHYDKKRKKIYITDEIFGTEIDFDWLAIELKKRIKNEVVTVDSSEPRSKNELIRRGINAVGAVKGAGSVEHGIKWLKQHEIIIDKKCQNVINEFGLYKWKEDKYGLVLPKPVDAYNHGIDALRYALEDEMRYGANTFWNL